MTVPAEPTLPQPADLIEYVGGRLGTDDAYAARKLAQAISRTDKYVLDSAPIGDTEPTDAVSVVPPEVLYEAYLEVGSALWDRRSATTGTNTYETIDGPTAPQGDPLGGVYADLDPYLRGGFA